MFQHFDDDSLIPASQLPGAQELDPSDQALIDEILGGDETLDEITAALEAYLDDTVTDFGVDGSAVEFSPTSPPPPPPPIHEELTPPSSPQASTPPPSAFTDTAAPGTACKRAATDAAEQDNKRFRWATLEEFYDGEEEEGDEEEEEEGERELYLSDCDEEEGEDSDDCVIIQDGRIDVGPFSDESLEMEPLPVRTQGTQTWTRYYMDPLEWPISPIKAVPCAVRCEHRLNSRHSCTFTRPRPSLPKNV